MKTITLDNTVSQPVKIKKVETTFNRPVDLYLDHLNKFDLDRTIKITARVAAILVMVFCALYIF